MSDEQTEIERQATKLAVRHTLERMLSPWGEGDQRRDGAGGVAVGVLQQFDEGEAMIKIFCDACEKELHNDENKVAERLRRERKFRKVTVKLEVLIGSGPDGASAWNSGALCEACVVKILIGAE